MKGKLAVGDEVSLPPEQHYALQSIYDYFRQHDKWPAFAIIDRQLHRLRGYDAQVLLRTIPRSMLQPATSSVVFQPADVMKLTLHGISCCHGSASDIDLFMTTLRWVAGQERDFDPDPNDPGRLLTITDGDLRRALAAYAEPGPSPDEIERLCILLNDEPDWGRGGSSHTAAGEWSFSITRDIRYFANVKDVGDYLAAAGRRRTDLAAASPVAQATHNATAAVQVVLPRWQHPVTACRPTAAAPGAGGPGQRSDGVRPDRSRTYDLAFSFTGEHRGYVEATKDECEELGLSVFYDRDAANDWWGKDVLREQRKVYSSRTRFFVPFISIEYFAKPYPRDEFSTAMVTAVEQGDDYILPVLMDDVEIPRDLLPPHTGHLRAKDYSPAELAAQLLQKVRDAAGHQEPRDRSGAVKEAKELRLPKVAPDTFSKYEELQCVFDYLGCQFKAAAPRLRTVGFICTTQQHPDRISVHVERNGETVYSLDIYLGGHFGDDKLSFGLDRHHGFSRGINGYAAPYYDRESGAPRLQVMRFTALDGAMTAVLLTKEELFVALWEHLVTWLETL